MTEQPVDTTAQPKLLAPARVRLRIAAGSVLVLVAGSLLAPRAAPSAISAPQEHAAPLLEEQAQLREVPRPFVGVQEAADRVRPYGVEIVRAPRREAPARTDFGPRRPTPERSGSGVFVTETHVLTHLQALDPHATSRIAIADGRVLDGRVVAYEPESGLIVLEVAERVQPPPIAVTPPPVGTLAVVAARREGRNRVAPAFVSGVSTDAYNVAIFGVDMAGVPLYTLDGQLFAITGGDAGAAFAIQIARDRLLALVGDPPRGSLGITLQSITPDLAPAFGDKGVLITSALAGGPADAAGIRSGDVLLSVGASNISTLEEATAALAALPTGQPATVRVTTAGRVRETAVTPALAFEIAIRATAGTGEAADAPRARDLFAAEILARAGIGPDARIPSVNGRRVTSAAQVLQEHRRRGRALAVLVQDGAAPYFTAIDPTP